MEIEADGNMVRDKRLYGPVHPGPRGFQTLGGPGCAGSIYRAKTEVGYEGGGVEEGELCLCVVYVEPVYARGVVRV